MLKYIDRRIRRGVKVKDDWWDSLTNENLKGMFSIEHFETCIVGFWNVLINKNEEHTDHKCKTFLSCYGVLGDF